MTAIKLVMFVKELTMAIPLELAIIAILTGGSKIGSFSKSVLAKKTIKKRHQKNINYIYRVGSNSDLTYKQGEITYTTNS